MNKIIVFFNNKLNSITLFNPNTILKRILITNVIDPYLDASY